MRILIFDNYDSFTYNLVQVVENIINDKADVFRNDKISLEQVAGYDKIILSPGPGLPKESGIMPELIREYAGVKPILGVCLGHQAIAECFGGKLINLPRVFHGVATKVKVLHPHEEYPGSLFRSLPNEFEAGRYHSWLVDTEGFPRELEITAKDENGQIMALRHKNYNLQGVQFHPESILTPLGGKMIENWLRD